jgi:hypothetical protein
VNVLCTSAWCRWDHYKLPTPTFEVDDSKYFNITHTFAFKNHSYGTSINTPSTCLPTRSWWSGNSSLTLSLKLAGLITDLISITREETLTRCHEASKSLRKFCDVYINSVCLRLPQPPPPFTTLD